MMNINENSKFDLEGKDVETKEIEDIKETEVDSVVLFPPWYIIWEKINATIGLDKFLEVKPMIKAEEFIWKIDIISNSYIKACSLAAILNKEYDYGNNSVKVNIYFDNKAVGEPKYPDGIPVKYVVKTLIEKALRDNPLFDSVLNKEIFQEKNEVSVQSVDALDADLALVFKKEVIQFYADDLNDLFLNYNIVASDVFEDVLKTEMFGQKLTFTTEPDALIKYIEK